MLSKVCNKIVNLLIQNHIIQKDDREIYYFGLYQMISFIFNTITTLVIVSFFNMYIEGLLFCVFYYLLRCYGGGYHSKSVIVCYILSILLIIAVLCITIKIKLSMLFLSIFVASFIFVFFVSPVETSTKKLDEKEKNDGIWACASILHLPKKQLREVLKNMYAALKSKGWIYTSFK